MSDDVISPLDYYYFEDIYRICSVFSHESIPCFVAPRWCVAASKGWAPELFRIILLCICYLFAKGASKLNYILLTSNMFAKFGWSPLYCACSTKLFTPWPSIQFYLHKKVGVRNEIFCIFPLLVKGGTKNSTSQAFSSHWLERLTANAKIAAVLGSISILRHRGIWGAADEAVLNKSSKFP